MQGEQDAGSRLRALGWHQGALIAVVPGSQLAGLLGADATHVVVASQDCDVVANVSTESCVDVLPASLADDAAGDLRYGKNPRRLCLELSNGQFANVDIRRRRTVEKAAVVDTAPLVQACVPSDRKILARWLGKRYARPAFPDEFNARLDAEKKKFVKLSKRDEGKLIKWWFCSSQTGKSG